MRLIVGMIIGAALYHFWITGEIDSALEEARSAIHTASKPETVFDQLKERLQ